MSEDIRNLNDSVNTLITEYRAKADRIEDAVTKSELEAIKVELKSDLQALREAQAAANAPKIEESAEEAVAKFKEAFGSYLTYGREAGNRDGSALRVKDVSLNVAAEGGVLLPKVFSGEMTDLLRKASPIRGLARVVRSGQNFVHPIKTAKGTAGLRSEKGSIASESTIAFNLLTFTPQAINARQQATAWAHDGDAQYNLVSMVLADIAASLGEAEGDFFLNSTNQNPLSVGSSANVKTGILANTKDVTGTDRFSNDIGSLSGVETATTDAIVFNDILNLRATLHGKYLANARYLMGSDTELALLKITDGEGRYIMSAGDVTRGLPGTLFGNSYIVDDNMPANGAGACRIVLADFSKYTIVDHSDLRWVVDQISDKTMVEYFAERRTAGAIADAQAFRGLYNKAA